MSRILIVDDHSVVRAGLKQFLAKEPDLVVAGEAATGEEALAKIRALSWDIVLLDISLPDRSGIDTLRSIKQLRPDLPVLILSMHPEGEYAVHLLQAGASGYASKAAAPEELISAIRVVLRGRKYVSPAVAETLVSGPTGGSEHTVLSDREFQIFYKLASGQTLARIAADLFLSPRTVSTYRARILQKMNMKTNAELTHYAVKHGLIE